MITQRQLDAIHERIAGLDSNARKSVLAVLERVDFDDKQALRDALLDILMPVCETSAQLAAELAGIAYNGFRVAELGEAIEVAATSTFQNGKYAAMVNTAVKKKTFDELLNVVYGFIGYTNRDSYSATMFGARRRDPKKPRYARVPQGSETCPFCMMLASRGFEYYRGEDGAKVHNHANCDCIYIPSWSRSPKVQGYNPEEWYEKWTDSIDDEAFAAAKRKGTDVNEEYKRIMSYYENSAKHAREGVNRSTWQSDRFSNFGEVRDYLQSAPTQQELEHRYSELGIIYGFEKMGSNQVSNALRHAEKRFGN